MLVAMIVSGALVALCIYLHFEVLRRIGSVLLVGRRHVRRPLLKVLFALFALHFVEVLLYAGVMLAMDLADLGTLQGATAGEDGLIFDHIYFSMASYTTLGIGDIVPHGPVRLIAAVEALNGLILIAWSASFTYLMMERLWRGELGAAASD